MIKEIIQPEMQDIMEMIHRYVTANKKNVCFVGSFLAFDEGKIQRDEDDITKDEAGRIFAYGHKKELKRLIDELKEVIKSETDKDGFVNV